MNPQTLLTQESIVTLILGIFIIIFLVCEYIAKGIIKSILEKGKNGAKATPLQLQMYLRAVSADSLLRFASLLLKISLTLTLALGFAKVFNGLSQLVLPDHMLGLSILIGYCGMISIYRILAPDLLRAAKKLFS